MTTDEERRNVAANIRNAANRRKDDLNDDPDYSPFAALYCVFCGVRGWPHYEDLLHLADLIDPPSHECTMSYNPEWSGDELYPTVVYKCNNCGQTVYDGVTRYCPSCGYKVSNYEKEYELEYDRGKL